MGIGSTESNRKLQGSDFCESSDSLHLCAKRTEELKKDQAERINVHFVRVRIPRQLLRAHVEFGAHLASVTGIDWHWCKCTQILIIFLLIHGSDQPEVSHLHHVIHREEDIRRLKISVHKSLAVQEIHSLCNLQEDVQTLRVLPELRQTPLCHPVLQVLLPAQLHLDVQIDFRCERGPCGSARGGKSQV